MQVQISEKRFDSRFFSKHLAHQPIGSLKKLFGTLSKNPISDFLCKLQTCDKCSQNATVWIFSQFIDVKKQKTC